MSYSLKLQKFKDEKLGHILAGAGVGAAASILGVPGPFGLVGRTLIGSAVGFASTTEQFQRMLFGEYDERLYVRNQEKEIDYIYKQPESYDKIKKQSFIGSCAFVEIHSFRDFMQNI